MSIIRHAKCWLLTRVDGVQLAFTDHDVPINFLGLEYTPRTISSSAIEKQALEANNLEVRAAFDDEAITYEDLFAGRYQNAIVDEFNRRLVFVPIEAMVRSSIYSLMMMELS